ncbi:HTTM domain-containing protein [Microbacterium galbinum]|uniref:HTTM domain-containing protein n=1 Tax=Microbacterium galbinum TaxID=2851646 RepID=A0ABY4IQS0_9MICO|nr:HTTM domain-containing protein [Microbacterium galbinum]UPL14605.1 HTTM domain-containing protein [Microbacterium galbinum]
MNAVTRLWDSLLHWLLDRRHATYGLAVMRIGFAGLTIVSILLYLPDYSYTFGEGSRWGESLYRPSGVNTYIWPISILFSRSDPDWFTYLKLALLLAVAVAYLLGWRMRIIAPLFVLLWLGYASTNPLVLNTGHYQTFRVMLLFLLLADTSRRWSLDARRRRVTRDEHPLSFRGRVLPRWVPVLSNNVAVILIGAQLCIVYITSALWKLQGSMWTEGIAAYYPLRLEQFILFPWLNEIAWHVTPAIFIASWLSVYMQLLFPLTLLNRWTRIFGLIAITGMHAGIGVLMSLPFFSLVMIFSDMIFVRDVTWRKVQLWVVRRWKRRRTVSNRQPDAGTSRQGLGEDAQVTSPEVVGVLR